MSRVVIVCCALLLFTAGDIKAIEAKDESYIIRRAYLDVLGILPTLGEISWYCEYNTDSYRVAVDWLIAKTGDDNKLRKLLLSKEYKEQKKTLIAKEKILENLFYLSGVPYKPGEQALLEVKALFISYSRESADTDIDAIDIMCNQLMSRASSVDEANWLLAVLRADGWIKTLDSILELEDVRCK